MRSIQVHTKLSISDAETAVREALAEQGFGILTEIDLAATLAAKLGVQRPPLKLLGACNPTFAHRALEADHSISLMLPCNIVLTGSDHGTTIATLDPRDMIDNNDIAELADEIASRLTTALSAVANM